MADDSKRAGLFITSDPDVTSITQPGADPARQLNDLPLRLMLVSNLAPQANEDEWSEPTRVHSVDKNSFQDVMQKLSPQLVLEVPNHVSDQPRLLDVELAFSSLDDFRPAAVARQVPALAQLLEIRTHIDSARQGRIDLDTFKDRLDAAGVDADWAGQLYNVLMAPPSAPRSRSSGSSGSSMLDRIFGMVGTGEDDAVPAPQPKPSGVTDSFIDAVVGEAAPSGPKVEKRTADGLIRDMDEVLGAQLKEIFSAPAFRRLEAAWRSLKFLVDRLPFRKNVQLEVLATDRDHLSEALYYQVLMPEHSGETGKAPLSALILDLAFDNSADDVEQLDDLAETGASLQVPIIATASATFFGLDGETRLDRIPTLNHHLSRPEYIAFNKLRERKEARYVSLALPSFLLREPYGEKNPAKELVFEEEGKVWGHASIATAAIIAKSFAETGWPTNVTGEARRLESLPLWKAQQGHTPLSAFVPDAKLSELAKAGFVVLAGRPNHDGIYIARAQTLGKPESFEDLMAATEARIHVTLACQLFVARAAHFLLHLQDTFEPVSDPEEEVTKRLRAFMHTEGKSLPREAVEVERVQQVDVPGQVLLAVRLRPPAHVLSRTVSLVMGVQVPTEEAASEEAE